MAARRRICCETLCARLSLEQKERIYHEKVIKHILMPKRCLRDYLVGCLRIQANNIWNNTQSTLHEFQNGDPGQGNVHCEVVEDNIYKILVHEKKIKELSEIEIFILSISACFHDIGKLNNSSVGCNNDHGKRSSEILMADYSKLCLTRNQAYAAALIISVHNNGLLENLPDTPIVVNQSNIINIKKLAALFRLADMLDTSYQRSLEAVSDTKLGFDDIPSKWRGRQSINGWYIDGKNKIILQAIPKNDEIETVYTLKSLMLEDLKKISPILRLYNFPYELDFEIKYDLTETYTRKDDIRDVLENQESKKKELSKKKPDCVNFTLTARQMMVSGSKCEICVWAYLSKQEQKMLYKAMKFHGTEHLITKTKYSVLIQRKTCIEVHLYIPKFEIDKPVDNIYWNGEIANASFIVHIPDNTAPGQYEGRILLYVESLQIARLDFILSIGIEQLDSNILVNQMFTFVNSAFASYSSKDRNEVLARIQGIQKIRPDIDIFLDIISLRSGENWHERLKEEIVKRDIFYLFWSLNASKSKCVKEEWRTALDTKGINFINPVPLVSPDQVPPPEELKGLHFDDLTLEPGFRSIFLKINNFPDSVFWNTLN